MSTKSKRFAGHGQKARIKARKSKIPGRSASEWRSQYVGFKSVRGLGRELQRNVLNPLRKRANELRRRISGGLELPIRGRHRRRTA